MSFQCIGRSLLRLHFNNNANKLHFFVQKSQLHTSGARCLINHVQREVNKYRHARENVQSIIGELKEPYRNKIEQHLDRSETNIIYRHDMETILFLAEDDRDLEFVRRMLRRYDGTSAKFLFGPVVMRLLYLLGKDELAYDLFTQSDTSELFHNLTSYVTLMDLLFETGNDEKVLEVYNIVTQRCKFEQFSKSAVVTIYPAACARLNTEKSFTLMKQLVSQCLNQEGALSVHQCMYAALLALRQGQPQQAFDFLMSTNLTNNYGSPMRMPRLWRNLHVMSLAALGKVEESLTELEKFLHNEDPTATPERLLEEVGSEIKEAVSKSQNPELTKRHDLLIKSLEQRDCLQSDRTLENFAFKTIHEDRDIQFKPRQRKPSNRPMRYRRDQNPRA